MGRPCKWMWYWMICLRGLYRWKNIGKDEVHPYYSVVLYFLTLRFTNLTTLIIETKQNPLEEATLKQQQTK